MTNTSAELSQGNISAPIPTTNPQPGPPEHQHSQVGGRNGIFKSGPLFISSKGIGWTSWKKRWFILTQTSLVFYRSDPSAVPQKGNVVNLTLGGIDLNNSGSVIVKPDKKLLTVQFPDAHDGRAFTLKAETTEDLYEWKTALDSALAKAPSAANVMEQNGIFRNDQTDSIDISLDQLKDREPMKSTVIGRPILLALEDVDGTPSFLEKALRFIEEHGANIEGILRQAADVDDVERRVREYEQGKVEFSADEDAHVIGDCVKYVLRELPSSPVPASCCKALLEACRNHRGDRVSSMRTAINDTFPEPNRRLLQRILLMMQTVASRKAVNRMSSSAVAACMAPLLLRPLLAGDCEIQNDFDVGGDGSVQLLQAAAAANHAQAIVITLLEEYNSIFGEGAESPDIYTDTEESGSESEAATDDEMSYGDEEYDDEEDESIHESDGEEGDDLVSESYSETGESEANDDHDNKDGDHSSPSPNSSDVSKELKVSQSKKLSSKTLERSLPQHEDVKGSANLTSSTKTASVYQSSDSGDIVGGVSTDCATTDNSIFSSPALCIKKSMTIANGPTPRRRTLLGRTSARKNLSMESIDFPSDDEFEIERLEAARSELQIQLAEEVEANAKLQSHVEKRRKALEERRLALERDVAKLQEQLSKEKNSQSKTGFEELDQVEVDLANLERKVDELGVRLNVQFERNSGPTLDISNQPEQMSNYERKSKKKADTEVAATSQSDRSISKDTHLAGTENDNERKTESTTFLNKQPPTSSRKSGTKGEVRRNQMGNELQSLDKGRDSSYSAYNLEKGKGSEVQGSEIQYAPNPEKGVRGLESSQSGKDKPHLESSRSGKGKSHQSSDKLRKSDSQPGYRSEGRNQQPKHLERGRSDGHHQSYNVDKGR